MLEFLKKQFLPTQGEILVLLDVLTVFFVSGMFCLLVDSVLEGNGLNFGGRCALIILPYMLHNYVKKYGGKSLSFSKAVKLIFDAFEVFIIFGFLFILAVVWSELPLNNVMKFLLILLWLIPTLNMFYNFVTGYKLVKEQHPLY